MDTGITDPGRGGRMAPTLPADVAAELESGRLWRAKEILRGRLSSMAFDPGLHEAYGVVLLRVGDDYLAGMHLFISGVRLPEYQPAIDLFLHRHRKAGWHSLAGLLPARARRLPLDELPPVVAAELRALGCPTSTKGLPKPVQTLIRSKRTYPELTSVGCFAILALFLVATVLGFNVIVRHVISWFR
jgi:hypothetical protein